MVKKAADQSKQLIQCDDRVTRNRLCTGLSTDTGDGSSSVAVRRSGEAKGWRVAVFIAVIGLHCLVGFIVIPSRTIRIASLHADGNLVLLSLPQKEHPPPLPMPAVPSHGPKRADATLDIPQPSNVAEPEPNNAITVPFDFGTDAAAAAKRLADQAENEKRRRNLAGPSDSQLEWWKNNAPLAPDHHLFGDDERAEGGELVTWMNDKCFYTTTKGITTFGMPQTSMVCKDPPKADGELFKDMRKKLDERAKGNAP